MTREAFTAAVLATQARLSLTDRDMAEYLGVPLQTWQHWRRGDREPARVAVRLVTVLGVVEALAPDVHAALLPREV
ncbi:MAG: hypothetical protein WC551_11025 [Patescibacteria group bacterium]